MPSNEISPIAAYAVAIARSSVSAAAVTPRTRPTGGDQAPLARRGARVEDLHAVLRLGGFNALDGKPGGVLARIAA
jgi:hypothetical protein